MPTLTDAICRKAQPRDKPFKLFDGNGLALVVLPSGTKSWRMFYRVDGRQQTKSFGLYPEVSLSEARRCALDGRAVMRAGGTLKKERKSPTLEEACETYWQGRKDVSPSYLANATRAMAMHVYPVLGAHQVRLLTRQDLLDCLLKLDAKGRHDYVRKVRMWVSQVLDWCVERGHCAANVAATIKPEKAFARRRVEHFAALDLREVPAFVQRLSLEAQTTAIEATWFLAYTWVRTVEARMMKWDELDGDLWRVGGARMKMGRDHLIPLPAQALDILRRQKARSTGSAYVFPHPYRDDRPMSANAVLSVLARIGYQGRMTGHGWRTIGSTWAHEAGHKHEAIERQLAHAPEDKVAAAYNRAAYLDERRAMLQSFADWLSSSGNHSNGAQDARE